MNEAYLLIGGNLGNRMVNLASARKLIGEKAGSIGKLSAIYETAPWGNAEQPAFYNQALQIYTPYASQRLLSNLLQIENELGRIRVEKYGARTIDIDILFFNNEIINTPNLTVPHRLMTERMFVLAPLNEIAAELIHPVLNKTIAELLNECEDVLKVKKLVGE
ncbi:MAG: 2-amino-4-hydroxy-6-hydroxymethyldihydropteridine diphosphokinase [Chitinophagaceae bacterium]|jgi:2-amino-4-hydroxy-6-hydroxymethyldihydropteridine diphosphokinase|nr:2-amino-4-hydroxy-6-hydroxymethyldihydropteridine diphosphokinase [Chitinophagaceae bacterium]